MKPTSLQANSQDSPLPNPRHEAFAQLVADGKSDTEAYAEVYGGKSRKAARSNAGRLIKKDYVRARIRFLQAENAKLCALSRAEKRQLLAQIARGEVAEKVSKNGKTVAVPPSVKDRISAIQEDNRMTGDAEDKINLSGSFTLNW